MEKKRVERGEQYWFASLYSGEGLLTINEESDFDEVNITVGNCFSTKAEAESMAKKLRAVFNGADVIEMPSEEEIVDAAEEHVEACDEEGYPYADDEDAKAAFGNGVAWLKSKIIK